MRKIIAPAAGIILVILVAVAGVNSLQRGAADRAAHAIVAVHGIVGSEKEAFFTDPDVVAEFARKGVRLTIDTQGSRDQAHDATKTGADFYFPAGEPAGRALAKRLDVKDASTPFYTPIVIASWEPIAKILAQNGIVEKSGSYYYIVHLDKLLDVVKSKQRWNELPHNGSYPVSKAVLISSTDARKSNSADMYLALASYIFNGNQIVQSNADERKVQADVTALFLRQGYQESSSAGPFEDYVSIGIGKTPMVIVYEQQFIEYLVGHPSAERPAGMVLMYPKPTIFTKHTIVATDDAGRKVAALLANDDVLKSLEIRHGFRTNEAAKTSAYWKAQKIELPGQILDVVDPPSFETLETMIKAVSDAFDKQ